MRQTARPITNVAQTGACRHFLPCQPMKDHSMPYIDINPHKSRPKWPAYVGLATLLTVTIAIVVLVLTSSS